MKKKKPGLRDFYLLWSTQALSQLGSAQTGFALTLWLYEKTGSAVRTALLSVCSYGPYVLVSIFAGALSDRWDKRRTILVCDALAALCSAAALLLLSRGALQPYHLYILNAVSGLMNTVQQPAGEVAVTLVTPQEHLQRTAGLRALSSSAVTILHPLLASSIFALTGAAGVICFDLLTFAAAFITLAFFVRIPPVPVSGQGSGGSFTESVRTGITYLRKNRLILTLILFLAGVNFVASAFDAALPPYVLSSPRGGERVLGLVTSCAGLAALAGGVLATVLPPPKSRVRVIWLTMLLSMGVENLILAFTSAPALWCAAQIAGWLPVPLMNANMDAVLRSTIPPELQGRVYSCRNALQFFTIPLGTVLGGYMTDRLSAASPERGPGRVMLILAALGVLVCLAFARPLREKRQ